MRTLADSDAYVYLAFRIAQYALLFAATVLITRALGPAGRAQYALTLALAAGVTALFAFSLDGAAGRLLGRSETQIEPITQSLMFHGCVLGALAAAASAALGLLVRSSLLEDAGVDVVLIASAMPPFVILAQYAGQLLVIRGAVRLHGSGQFAAAVFAVIGAVIVIALPGEVTPAIAAGLTLAGFVVLAGLMVGLLARLSAWRALVPRGPSGAARDLWRVAIQLHPTSVSLQLMPRLNLLIVAAFVSADAVGVYSVAQVLALTVTTSADALSTSAVSRQLFTPLSQSIRYTADFARQSGLLVAALAAVVAVLAYPMVLILYGDAFAEAVLPLVVLLVAVPASAIEAPFRTLLVRFSHPVLVSVLTFATLLLTTAATAVFTLVSGTVGAAVAMVIGYWGLMLAVLVVAKRLDAESISHVFRRPTRRDEAIILLRHVAARNWSALQREKDWQPAVEWPDDPR